MEENYKKLDIYKFWQESELHSQKGNTFFEIYDELFSKYRGKNITFVEIGVKWGGSLLMWKKYFGENSRIIGVDLIPEVKNLEKYGVEIFIGDQSSPTFWESFYNKVGKIDILLDDGAHTNEAQIISTYNSVKNINDGGLIVIEDILSSYQKSYLNPSKYSFVNYSKFLIDDINGRVHTKHKQKFKGIFKKHSLNKYIYATKYFTNFIAFFIDRKKCFEMESTINRDLTENKSDIITDNYKNPKWDEKIKKNFITLISKLITNLLGNLKNKKFFQVIRKSVHKLNYTIIKKKIDKKIKKYFD